MGHFRGWKWGRQYAADELFALIEAFENRLSGRIAARHGSVDEMYGALSMDESVDDFLEQIRGR